jgi:hypothetical protein
LTKYFNIRFPGIIIDRDINVIKTDKDLTSKIGKPRKIERDPIYSS